MGAVPRCVPFAVKKSFKIPLHVFDDRETTEVNPTLFKFKNMKTCLKLSLAIVISSVCAMSAQATTLLSETFSYADGDLTNVSAGAWGYHSGAVDVTNDLSVVAGRAFINQNDGA